MSLRMNTADVIQTGLSFLAVVVALHVAAFVLSGAGFLMYEVLGEEECGEDYWSGAETCTTEPSTASLIVGLLFWIPAGIILISGYIGIWTKLLTDSIAVGVYKANNADSTELVMIQNQPTPVAIPQAVVPAAAPAAPTVQPTEQVQQTYQQGQRSRHQF